MKILAVETSCDETSAAIVKFDKKEKYVEVISNVIATSLQMHQETGGIIPENAAREQLKYIIPVINQALKESSINESNIDMLAVTIGPGLIGSLLVGVETVKTLAYIWKKPVIPVNHLFGHIYANFIGRKAQEIKFPSIALIVSGGHTDLVLITNHENIKWLGGTRDDAAGEALDKTGRLLGLPYPAGPKIEELARQGKDNFKFPRPLIYSSDYDFSFSGLKTAVLREVEKGELDKKRLNDFCASVQQAIIDVLVKKTLKAAKEFGANSIILGGGVAANQKLRDEFSKITEIYVPEKKLCTDNAAMIGAAAAFLGKESSWETIETNPELYFD